MSANSTFQRILVATDFSPSSDAALSQAVWLTRKLGAQLTIAHVLPDLRKALLSASTSAHLDTMFGDGNKFHQEIRQESDAKMRVLISRYGAEDMGVTCETLLGDPPLAIVHAILQEKHDLVVVGTRGRSGWESVLLGSTAKRLIRNAPIPVWTVKADTAGPPKRVLATTDFSDASRKAVLTGWKIAQDAGAEFHLLHVIDSHDIPEGLIERVSPQHSLRDQVNTAAEQRLNEFITALGATSSAIQPHLTWGTPSQEIARLSDHLQIDLTVLATVGRTGLKGVLMGNTAEKVLDSCKSNILVVKPDDFVCPIDPPFWPLH